MKRKLVGTGLKVFGMLVGLWGLLAFLWMGVLWGLLVVVPWH